jgi:hypothetical protein
LQCTDRTRLSTHGRIHGASPSVSNLHQLDGRDRFLKWEQLGRNLNQTGCLQAQLHFQKQFMGMSQLGARTARKMIADNLTQGRLGEAGVAAR